MYMPLGNVELERQRYVNWLAAKVDGNLSYSGYTFGKLFECLFDIPFFWVIDRDINRAEDGNRLRIIYVTSHIIKCDQDDLFDQDGCSFLEFMVGLAMRCDDILYEPGEDHTAECFWEFMHNIGLDVFDDESFGRIWDYNTVSNRVNMVLERQYGTDGTGGLFPLKHPREDQRGTEIWYQLQAYLREKND